MQIRAVTTCEDTATDKGLGGELPDVDIRTDGSATLEITAEGISMSQLPGKTVVIYRGKSTKEKHDIVACGVIAPKK
jgi:Cu/Zn superoxide dismutase